MDIMIALILSIAMEMGGVPPYFVLSIALTENHTLNPNAINKNSNGTYDRGLMQLNSGWYSGNWQDPETNIRAAINHIKWIAQRSDVTTWWQVAIIYNMGYTAFREKATPNSVIEYANQVYEKWHELNSREAIGNYIVRK